MATETILGTTGNDLLQGQQLSGIENDLVGLAGDDTLIAANAADTLHGGAGADSLSFGTGLTINNGALVGGVGNDTFFAVGTTVLTSTYEGKSGTDTFNFTAATNIASASVRGGEGADTINFVAGGATLNGFVATLGQGGDVVDFTGSSFVGGLVYGGKDNDTLDFGNNLNAVTIGGNEGADVMRMATATFVNATVGSGKGHDLITSTAGALVATIGSVVGGLGSDTINLTMGAASTTTQLQVFGDKAETGDTSIGMADQIVFTANGLTEFGSSSIYGGAGADTILFGGFTAGANTAVAVNAFGGNGNDSISFRAAGASSLVGGAGADTLIGNLTLTGAAINSAFNLNGGAGVDRILIDNTGATFLTGGFTGAGIEEFVVGSFTDAGDNIILQSFGANTANYSGVNFIATGAQALAAQMVGGTATTNTGAFVFNLTGGLSSVAVSGLRLGDMNIYEAGGDTIIQILNTTEFTASTAFGIGDAIGTATTAGSYAAGNNQIYQVVLSGNLGVIDNGTAGFISTTGVALTFGIASNATDGRNGFTITVA